MAFVLRSNVYQLSTTTGAGSTIALLNDTVTVDGVDYGKFSDFMSNGDRTWIKRWMGSAWEELLVEYSSGSLTVVSVLASTNGGAQVNWGAGTKRVFCALPASAAGKIVQVIDRVQSKSANYTVVATDAGSVLLVSASGAARTITLPAAASSTGLVIGVKKSDSSANTVTIDGNGSETIDGATTLVLRAQHDTLVLICDGTGWQVISDARGRGGWEHIATTVLSNVADWSQTGLGGFRKLRITGFLRPATDAATLALRTSTNDGSSYDAGGSDYRWQGVRSTSTSVDALTDTADAQIAVGYVGAGNASTNGIQFEIVVDQFNQATYAWVMSRALVGHASGIIQIADIHGQRLSTTARDAVRLLFSSGNIASGQVTIEGVRG